jgi:Streptomyces sporulation and cell division protein, SsgA
MIEVIHRPLPLWDAARYGDEPYDAWIVYRAADPFAVTLLLPGPDGVHEVVFGRALLIDGLEWPSGEGMVRVEPHEDDPDYLILWPTSRRDVLFYVERAQVEKFIDATYRVVPLGGELPLADKELDRWLAEVTA